jgi:hypothetical protein
MRTTSTSFVRFEAGSVTVTVPFREREGHRGSVAQHRDGRRPPDAGDRERLVNRRQHVLLVGTVWAGRKSRAHDQYSAGVIGQGFPSRL